MKLLLTHATKYETWNVILLAQVQNLLSPKNVVSEMSDNLSPIFCCCWFYISKFCTKTSKTNRLIGFLDLSNIDKIGPLKNIDEVSSHRLRFWGYYLNSPDVVLWYFLLFLQVKSPSKGLTLKLLLRSIKLQRKFLRVYLWKDFWNVLTCRQVMAIVLEFKKRLLWRGAIELLCKITK